MLSSGGPLYIPTSAFALAKEMGIDQEVVENVAIELLGEEEAAWSKERCGQYLMQQEWVEKFSGASETTCASTGCRLALTSGIEPFKDVMIMAEYASAMVRGAGQGALGVKQQFFGTYGANPGLREANGPARKQNATVAPHQPPSALVPDGTPQRLFPQCLICSNEQGGQIGAILRKLKGKQRPRRRLLQSDGQLLAR